MSPAEKLVNDKTAAALLDCSRTTLWRRVKDGTIPPAIRIGGLSRWKLSDIQAVITAAEANRPAKPPVQMPAQVEPRKRKRAAA